MSRLAVVLFLRRSPMKVKNYFSFLLIVAAVLFSASDLRAATISPNIFDDPTVSPVGQPGACSLRYAIQSINNGSPFAGCTNDTPAEGFGMNDTIILQAGPYVLTIMGNNEDANVTGDLDVLKDIKIIGAGPDQTSIDASGISGGDRVIQFLSVTNASITGVTIKGGDVSGIPQDGGGILAVTEFLTLEEVQIIGNKAGQGGGISVSCQPSILDSVIQGNQAMGIGGGIFLSTDAFCSTPPLVASIESSQILGNISGGSGGGIGSTNSPSFLRIDNSTIDGNTAASSGGGVAVSLVGITNSTISHNQATSEGGGILGSQFLFLTNSTVSTNTAASGGGIVSAGGLKGAYNVTIAFNEATTSGGGIFNPITFSQLDTRFPMTFFNTIIAKNTAPTGPDCSGDFGSSPSGGFNLIGDIGTCTGFTDMVNGDQVGSSLSPIDPGLLPLDFYGGSTQTHALDRNSLAVDMGNNTVTGCKTLDQDLFITTFVPYTSPPPPFHGTINFVGLTDDQRFFLRPIAILDPNVPICDIGAFELQTFTFNLTKNDGLGGASIKVGGTFTYTMVLTNNGPGDANDVSLNDPLPAQVDFISLTTTQGTCASTNDVVNCDLGDMPHGSTVTVTVTVKAVATGDAVNTATVTTSVGDFVASVTTKIIVIRTQGGTVFNCSLTRGDSGEIHVYPAIVLFAIAMGLVFWHLRRHARSR
jgi:uncharacterized repeat protein (TIGR01451 family)